MGQFDRITRHSDVMDGKARIRGMHATAGMIVGGGALPVTASRISSPAIPVR
ncbi:MAG: hypothetical protein ABFD97_09620 [Syntrophobacter sp.]